MTKINRIMRLWRNPDARGFIVAVLEQTGPRCEITGALPFKTIAESCHGTKKAAEKAYDALKTEYILGVPGVRQP
jgi:hypothetical protein